MFIKTFKCRIKRGGNRTIDICFSKVDFCLQTSQSTQPTISFDKNWEMDWLREDVIIEEVEVEEEEEDGVGDGNFVMRGREISKNGSNLVEKV